MGQNERRQTLAPEADLSNSCSDLPPALNSSSARAPDLMIQALPVMLIFDPLDISECLFRRNIIFSAAGGDALRNLIWTYLGIRFAPVELFFYTCQDYD